VNKKIELIFPFYVIAILISLLTPVLNAISSTSWAKTIEVHLESPVKPRKG